VAAFDRTRWPAPAAAFIGMGIMTPMLGIGREKLAKPAASCLIIRCQHMPFACRGLTGSVTTVVSPACVTSGVATARTSGSGRMTMPNKGAIADAEPRSAEPVVRPIGLADLRDALSRGLADFKAMPTPPFDTGGQLWSRMAMV
jgi:hypothetical protein